jgi:TP53 regulating kinase and related kinases
MKQKTIAQGAEAVITLDENKILKNRIPKSYRIKELDEKIIKLRTRAESKILTKSKKTLNVPEVLKTEDNKITMEFIDGLKLSDNLNNLDKKEQIRISQKIGTAVSKLHNENIIHGDLTTSNMILKKDKIYLIDFGLGYQNGKYEDKAVDLHLLKQALEAKHFEFHKELFESFKRGYLKINETESKKVLERLIAVEKRGRYKKH